MFGVSVNNPNVGGSILAPGTNPNRHFARARLHQGSQVPDLAKFIRKLVLACVAHALPRPLEGSLITAGLSKS